MRKRVYLTGVITTVIFLSVLSSTTLAGPKMQIDQPSFEWGVCSQQVNLYHTFWIKSVGDKPLEIKHIVPGCGCTKAPIDDTLLAPGDSTALRITLDTRRYVGRTVKTPKISTNAEEKPSELELILLPTNDPEDIRPVSISALKLDVSQFSQKPRRKVKFTMHNSGERDFSLKLVEVGCDDMEVDIPDLIYAGETITGYAIVKEAAVTKEFDCSFTLEVGKELRQRYTVSVDRIIRIKD